MRGQKIGYIRVSTIDQNEARQLLGLQLDKIFTDKISAKASHRPQLELMLEYIRENDEVYVHSMDRLARNSKTMNNLVNKINSKGAKITFIKENLSFCGNDSPMSQLLLSIMGAFSDFEISIQKERQKEGIALAKEKGLYKGRKPSLSTEQINSLKSQAKENVSKKILMNRFNISRATLYKYLN